MTHSDKPINNWLVYIVRCSDDTLYTGITTDIQRRLQQHNNGTGAKYTRGRGPVSLVKSFASFTKSEALKLEYQIKQFSKKEKLALIDGSFTDGYI